MDAHPADRRPRLTPAVADLRRAVRTQLEAQGFAADSLLLVGLSGGADSLALAAAVAFEAPRAGLRAGAVIIDHQLQAGSAAVAERAAEQARSLGLDPVLVRAVSVSEHDTGDGPEATARQARYTAFERVALERSAAGVLLAHTLDDQAETVLLGLARGSGVRSLAGMAPVSRTEGGALLLRPLLGIRRSETVQACSDQHLEPWFDPHNDDPSYTRVRVRKHVLPTLETELGPGVSDALARTAEQLREDADVLDVLAAESLDEAVVLVEGGIGLSVSALAAHPAAIRNRLIRRVIRTEFEQSLSREHTLAIAQLVENWHGQAELNLPGITVRREGSTLAIRPNTK